MKYKILPGVLALLLLVTSLQASSNAGAAGSINWTLPFYFESSYGSGDWNSEMTTDVNGDGLSDVVIYSNYATGSTDYYKNNGDGTWTKMANNSFPCLNRSSTERQYCHFPDLNGDGLADNIFLEYTYIGNYAYLASNIQLNTGNGWVSENNNWKVLPLMILSKYRGAIQFFDINGDGLSDLVVSYQYSGSSTKYQAIYLNTGTGWDRVFYNYVP